QIKCFRCQKLGHRAAECRAPAPAQHGGTHRVGAGRPTGRGKAERGPAAPPSQALGALKVHPKSALAASSSGGGLITLSVRVDGITRSLNVLSDAGASSNFARGQLIEGSGLQSKVKESRDSELVDRLENGTTTGVESAQSS
ncbi:TPA: hypothetical protein N0F65_003754, partial [Lagenidium giganteum]